MNLSVCIITKNECEKLRRCLESLKKYDFEIVVVDTGSTDGTCDMVREYTNQLYTYDWCDDFAAAKNAAIAHAANELVLILDSDEYMEPLPEAEVQYLEKEAVRMPDRVGRIYRINELDESGERENYEWINRLFFKKRFYYKGRIHEQVVPVGKESGYETWLTPIRIRHDGYMGTTEQKLEKAKRNIRLLERELDTKEDPYLLYQLGKSYCMAGEPENGVKCFDRALAFDLNPKLEYVIDLVESFGYALINSGQTERALQLERIYDEFGGSADFQFLMGLVYMKNGRFAEAVVEFQKASAHGTARVQGANSYLAYYNIGVIYECLGNWTEAEGYYQKALPYSAAKRQLDERRMKVHES